MLILAFGCLFPDEEWYAQRFAELTDDDGDGFNETQDDCDDADPAVFRDAPEMCDGLDNDCDGDVDEALTVAYYGDADADGYGTETYSVAACSVPEGYVNTAGDCDDADADVSPRAVERCDGVDEDCDGRTDEDPVGAPAWFVDADGDGYGNAAYRVEACAQPQGYVADGEDCDDTEPLASPGEAEVCYDAIDNDCDGTGNGCGPAGEHSLADADAILLGETDGDEAGAPIVGLGDVNGDGYDDFIVGAIGSERGAVGGGGAYIVTGPLSGATGLGASTAVLVGDVTGAQAGFVGGGGDLTGDGIPDAIVGAPIAGGLAYVVDGTTTGTVSLGGSMITLTLADGGFLGFASDIADLDGDGADDLVIGAPLEDGAGVAYVLTGPLSTASTPAGAWARIEGAAEDGLGFSVVSRDFDGDGLADVLAGAPSSLLTGSGPDSVYYFAGVAGGTTSVADADAHFSSEHEGEWAGHPVASAGDVNADGYLDALIGAHRSDAGGTDSGVAYLVLGPFSGDSNLGSAAGAFVGSAGEYAGFSLAGEGDVNGDGVEDLLIGAPGSPVGPSSGASYLFLGSFTGVVGRLDAAAVYDGEFPGDSAGAVRLPGDVNADGLDDMLFGAWEYGGSGAVYVVTGGGL